MKTMTIKNYWTFPAVERKEVNVDKLIEKVSAEFNVLPEQLKKKSRKRRLVDARSVLFYILHRRLGMGSVEAGKLFNRDHATVLHNCKKVDNLMSYDRTWLETINKFV